MSQEKLRLALSVVSSRVTELDIDECGLLGLNTYGWHEGCIMECYDEIKKICEDIVFHAIIQSSLALPILK